MGNGIIYHKILLAITATKTSPDLDFTKILLQLSIVAPVVTTSSINNIFLPLINSKYLSLMIKALATFRILAFLLSPI